MFCPNCGTQNPDSGQACTKCGFQLKGAAVPKFKGTMMMNQAAPTAPTPPTPLTRPTPPPTPVSPPSSRATPAPSAAVPGQGPGARGGASAFKGTVVGVAGFGGGGIAPTPPRAPSQPPQAPTPPRAPSYPPQQPASPYGAAPPASQSPFGAAQPPSQSPYGGAAPPEGAGPVNPMGSTMADPASMFGAQPPPGAFGAPPGSGAFGGPPPGAPPSGFGPPGSGFGPPGSGFGPPGSGFGGPPPQGFGAPPQQGFPPASQQGPGFGAPSQGYGPPPQQYGAPPSDYNPAQNPAAMQLAGNYAPQPYGQPQDMTGPSGTMAGVGVAAVGMIPAGAPGAMMMGGGGAGGNGPKGVVRNGTQVLLFSLLSCGIYQVIWFISICNEMAGFLKRDEPSWLKVMGLSLVTCNIYGLYWFATRFGALVAEIQQRAGVQNPQNLGWMYLIPYYNLILITDELNKAWQTPG